MTKISLHGFNNLTKSLSFSLYKLHYFNDKQTHQNYNAYVNEHFCANNLTALLTKISHAIGGNVLNIAKQDYQPQGASVTLMISEEAQPISCAESLVAHLDKSHICIHTYPDDNPCNNIAIFRADIELSTCGVISPLRVLNYVIEEFDADVIDIDYRIRGMTRDKQGNKIFVDDNLINISDYLSPKSLTKFDIENHNMPSNNLFHSKLSKTEVLLDDFLFGDQTSDLTVFKQEEIKAQIRREIKQLFTSSTQLVM